MNKILIPGIFFVIFNCPFVLMAQSDTIPLIRSGELIDSGTVLHDNKKYDEALRLYAMVPENDTSYIRAQYETALTLSESGNKSKSIEVCLHALKSHSEYKAELLNQLGNAYDDNNEIDKAISTFQEGIAEFPNDHLLHYNLGLTYFHAKDIKDAIHEWQQALRIDPFHPGSNNMLGRVMILQGDLTKAFLSLTMYLALVPGDNNTLVLLNNMLNDAVTDEGTEDPTTDNSDFHDLDLLIKSKAALDPRFHHEVIIDVPVVKQTELILDNLKLNPSSDDFWMNFYVPFYQALKQQGMDQTLIYYMLSSTNIQKVKDWKSQHDKDLNAFFDLANAEINKMRLYRMIKDDRGNLVKTQCWYFKDNKLNAIGNEEQDKTRKGRWIFYYNNGEINAEGNYDQQGNKTGIWKYYYPDGILQKSEIFNDAGELNGDAVSYYENGNIMNKYHYRNNSLEDTAKFYYKCGALNEEYEYEKDTMNGPGKVFYNTGELETEYANSNGQLNGPVINYYRSGAISGRSIIKSGQLDGADTTYFRNGSVNEQGIYREGEKDGIWRGFYENGKPSYTGNYSSGKKTGKWQSFYDNGFVESTKSYDENGLRDGEFRDFTEDSLLLSVFTFEKDKLIKAVFYDRSGKVSGSCGDAEGNFKLTGYYIDGKLNYSGQVVNGRYNGDFEYYYHNGKLKKKEVYINDTLEGPYFEYHESGPMSLSTSYKKNQLSGYYRSFYVNGMIQNEGWYVNGKRQQTWKYYDIGQKLTNLYYYLNDKEQGHVFDYDQVGRLTYSYNYDQGTLLEITQYDTAGNIMNHFDLPNGTGAIKYLTSHNQVDFTARLCCGEDIDNYNRYYENGKMQSVTQVMYTARNGDYLSYYENGKLQCKGHFTDNRRTGLWKWYFENGNLETAGIYKDGDQDSIWVDYYENGTRKSRASYRNDLRYGISDFYSEDGQLIIEKMYDEFGITGYRYNLPDGSLCAPVKIQNGEGKITTYFPNGKVAMEQLYHLGMLNGTERIYHSNGILAVENEYLNGSQMGTASTYYRDGKPKSVKHFMYNQQQGESLEYYPDGKIKLRSEWINDDKEGPETEYNEDGSVRKITYWRDGIIY